MLKKYQPQSISDGQSTEITKHFSLKMRRFLIKKKKQTNEEHIFDSMVAVSSYTYARP